LIKQLRSELGDWLEQTGGMQKPLKRIDEYREDYKNKGYYKYKRHYNNWNKIKLDSLIFDVTRVNEAWGNTQVKPVHGIISADVLMKGKGIIDYYNHCLYLK